MANSVAESNQTRHFFAAMFAAWSGFAAISLALLQLSYFTAFLGKSWILLSGYEFQSHYTVLGPAQNSQITVRETLTIFFNDQPLTELPARELIQSREGVKAF